MIVWVIGRNYPLSENGMQGSFELEQAKMLSCHGNDVHYLACSLHPAKRINKKSGIQSWTDDGVKVSVLSAFFTPRVYPVYFVKGRNKLWMKLMKDIESKYGTPDVIHVHYPAMLMIAESLEEYRNKGVQIVATEHWTKVLNKVLDKIEMQEYIKTAETVDKMICVGSPLARAVKDLTGKDATVIPNVLNGVFKPSDEKHDGFRFVSVGRLVKLKQFDKIIEAFSECFAGNSEITLTIVGNGKEKAHLQKMIDERNMQGQIRLAGGQTREKTADIVANSDCLICFSTFETFGVPIIEAWACGIIVVSSDTAAAAIDYYDQKLGVKVSPKDTDALKQALLDVYMNRKMYDKKYISEYAQRHFSENAVYTQLMTTYSE